MIVVRQLGQPAAGTQTWECVRAVKAALATIWPDNPGMPQQDSSPYFDMKLMAALEYLANRRGGQALVEQLRGEGPGVVSVQLDAAGVRGAQLECLRQAWAEWKAATGYGPTPQRGASWAWWLLGVALVGTAAVGGYYVWRARRGRGR